MREPRFPASLLVLYGSQTGNAQDVAERIASEGKHRMYRARCMPMDAMTAEGLAQAFVVFVCSTTGAPPRAMSWSACGPNERLAVTRAVCRLLSAATLQGRATRRTA